MTPQSEGILCEVLNLPPVELAELVERILASFEFPARKDIDAAWAQEVEARIDAFGRGESVRRPPIRYSRRPISRHVDES
jgi:putative addiction module component (TIGR02574 family)